MLEQCYNHSKQCRTNVAMLCCDKSRRCESCLVTPLLWRECCTCSCSLFFTLRLTFTLLDASISHFLTIPIKFSGFSSNKIDLFCFFSLSVFHVNIDIKSKKNNRLCCCCLSLKVHVAVQFTVQTHGRMKCKIFIPAYIKGGRTYGSTDDFLRPQISWVHRQGCQNAPASGAISGYFKGFAPCNLGNISLLISLPLPGNKYP